MIIKTTKYNEVAPSEIQKLLDNGARIEPYITNIGVFIGEFVKANGEKIKVYSADTITINNVTLNLCLNADYNFTIEIN